MPSSSIPSPVKTLGAAAAHAIEKYFQKILTHEAEVLKDRDPEELHQMRVGMRRLRSATAGFGPVLDLPKEVEERRIGKIARILGTLRDLDVMLEAIQTRYQPTLPPEEQEAVDQALMELIKQRHRAFKAVRGILESRHYQSLKRAVQEWLEKPKFQAIAQLPLEEVLPDLLLPQVSELFLHPAWLIGVTSQAGKQGEIEEMTPQAVEQELAEHGESLHNLRKQAKRLRYLMNLFTDFYGAAYEAYLEDMKAIQEYLGEIQDAVVLEEFLVNIFEYQLKEHLPNFAAQLAQNRYESWQKWQTLQRRYLTPQIRLNFRSELIRPVLEPSSSTNHG
ncbi:MAG: CHAD domain-containing protein [Actinomycetota bacterium]